MSNRHSLLSQVLSRWLIDEPGLAPAVDCASCTLADERPTARDRWQLYKCCTFQPFLANFACGAAGERALQIDSRKAVLQPLGVIPTLEFRQLYESTSEDQRGENHLCSYYRRESRSCSIWSARPAECSSHFCGAIHADPRERFSQRAFHLEVAVAQMGLVHFGFSPEEISHQIDLLNAPNPRMKSLAPREAAEIYQSVWAWTQSLKREEILSWLDSAPQGS